MRAGGALVFPTLLQRLSDEAAFPIVRGYTCVTIEGRNVDLPELHCVAGGVQLLAALTGVVLLATASSAVVRNSGRELLIGAGNAGAGHGRIIQPGERVGGSAAPYLSPAIEAVVGN